MKIALIDTETTGLDARQHEIIDFGMVIFDSHTFEVYDTYEAKVRPLRIDDANPKALEVNGYNEKEWEDAISLEELMKEVFKRTHGALFCAHNMIFDWSFLAEAERTTGIILPFDYHKLDLLTLAWSRIPHSKVQSWSLKTICTYLRVPLEPKVHRALNGAMCGYWVYKALFSNA